MPIQAKVTANTPVSHDVWKLSLEIAGAPEWTFQAGQFVIVPVPQRPEDTKPPKGFYSVASSPSALPALDLLVEHRHDGGYVSGWMASRQIGETLTLDGPLGHFGLHETNAKGQVFLGMRAGVAPLRGMLLASLAAKAGKHHWLFLGGKGTDDLLLDKEWRALDQADPHFHYHPVVQPTADNPFVGKNSDPADEVLKRIAQRTGLRLYLAGFSRDVEPMQAKLLAGGFSADDLKIEKFG